MNERDTRLGTVLTLREETETVGSWRLTEFLGGGLKAQVYRGVSVDDRLRQAAVKITAREGGPGGVPSGTPHSSRLAASRASSTTINPLLPQGGLPIPPR